MLQLFYFTVHGSRFTAILIFLLVTTVSWTQNTTFPTFSASILEAAETSGFNESDPGAVLFKFPTMDLLAYIQDPKRQVVEFVLKVGDVEKTIVLKGNKYRVPGPYSKNYNQTVFMRGEVLNEPDSRASILVSKTSFFVLINSAGKQYSISNASFENKIVSGVFSFSEKAYHVSKDKKDFSNTEDACTQANVDLGIQFDESFASNFASEDLANDFAYFSVVGTAYSIWLDLDSRVFLNVIWTEYPIPGDPLWDDDLAVFEAKILSNWEVERPCVRRDGIVYFTGKSIGGMVQGHTDLTFAGLCENGPDGLVVSTISGLTLKFEPTETGKTVAHEIGHQLGLQHQGEPPCELGGCPLGSGNSDYLIMCEGGGTVISLSACHVNVLNGKFTGSPSKCECITEAIPYYVTDVCGRCFAKVTDLVVDNPNPAINCAASDDIMNFSAIVKGGCNRALKPIRARFKNDFAQVVLVNGRFSNYFTHTRIIAGNYIELIAREVPGGPNDDSNKELIFDFENEASQLAIDFTLKYAPSNSLPEENYVVSVYMDNYAIQFGIKEKIILPFFTRVIQPGQSIIDVIEPGTQFRRFHIVGDLNFSTVLPPNLPNFSSYLYEIPIPGNSNGLTGYNMTGFQFKMDGGNKLQIDGDVKLKLLNANVEGCQTMWAGIELADQASLECVNTKVKDAQFGVKLNGRSIADVRQSTFENNNYGFYALMPANTVPLIITLSGNTFATTSTLKSAYAGQSPLPFGGKGYSGVYVENVPALNISSAGGLNSQFSNLHNGILSYNSNVSIRHTFFENIQKEPGAPNLPGGISAPGKGVYTKNGSIMVKGEGILGASPATFTNCHTAVEGFQASLTITENKMLSVNNGVISNIGVNKKVFVSTNDIQAKDRGIAVFHALALPGGCQVNSNTIRMIGNAQGVGIKTGGSGDFWQQEGLFSQNNIIVTDGAAGIDVGVSRNLKVNNNNITLGSGSTQYGIGILGGDLNGVNCNMITGAGQKGIYGLMAGRSNFVCNTTSNTGIGLNFEGVFVGKGTIRVAGNTMLNNTSEGLLLGTDAVIGEQVHQGNNWAGTGFTLARHLGAFDVALRSKFTVDADENASFLPDVVLPVQWFINITTPTTSYQCLPNNSDCPIVQATSDNAREKEIAKGQLTGLNNQAPQLWTAQRRLYERLTEEVNPYPNDVDFNNFLAASQGNGIKAYADLQIGLRQMFQSSLTDRSDLGAYETQILTNLDQLDQTEGYLNTPGISHLDSISVAALRNGTMQNIASLSSLRDTKLNSIISARLNSVNTLLSLNNSLSGSQDFLLNEKRVNGIYLETVAANNLTLSNTQIAHLQAIAAQCPLSGGESVLRARDLLALMQVAPIFYNDEIFCGSLKPSQDRFGYALIEDFIQVRPNPASETITIKYTLPDGLEHQLVILNLVGKPMGTYLLEGKEGEKTISIGNFPSGVYWYSVTGGESAFKSGKLIIQH